MNTSPPSPLLLTGTVYIFRLCGQRHLLTDYKPKSFAGLARRHVTCDRNRPSMGRAGEGRWEGTLGLVSIATRDGGATGSDSSAGSKFEKHWTA